LAHDLHESACLGSRWERPHEPALVHHIAGIGVRPDDLARRVDSRRVRHDRSRKVDGHVCFGEATAAVAISAPDKINWIVLVDMTSP
jgi:hypothetical protein